MKKPRVTRTKSQVGKLSRRKGATAERWIANQLKLYFADSHRQPQSQIKQLKAIAANDPIIAAQLCLTDVVAGPFGIEVKHRKVLPHIDDTLQQAISDVGSSKKIPVAIHRPSPGTIYDIQIAMMYFGDVLRMGWIEFLANCDRISKEHASDKLKPME